MKKAILALAVAALFVITPAFAATGDLIYDLSTDIDAFLSGDGGTDFLENAGDGQKNASKDGGLKFGTRPNDYSVVDLKVAGNEKFDDSKDYTLRISYKADTEQEFRLVSTKGYANLVDPVEGTSATLTFTFKGNHANIRLQTSSGDPFTITSLKVYEGTSIPSSPGGGGKKSGDATMIALAIAALTLGAGATVFFTRKVKA
ncbi:MAG: hypothetical protein FWG31_05365 [Oscillospiraceae bacterium]|nr:hypothetical protein [Oscillospiraceae bacterium]